MPKQFQVLVCLMAFSAVGLTSCSRHRSANGGEIQLVHSAMSMFSEKNPLFYKGRKGGYDYFMIFAGGKKRNLKCPVETSFIEAPFPFTSEQKMWKDVSGKSRFPLMPEVPVPISISEKVQ